MRWARKIAPAVVWALCVGWGAWGLGQGSSAARVTVRQVDSFGTELAAEAYVYTDETFTSVEAPVREGYRFTHWEVVEPSQPGFVNRDAWGRALDAVSVVPKLEIVTLKAVYADATEDTDGDGVKLQLLECTKTTASRYEYERSGGSFLGTHHSDWVDKTLRLYAELKVSKVAIIFTKASAFVNIFERNSIESAAGDGNFSCHIFILSTSLRVQRPVRC